MEKHLLVTVSADRETSSNLRFIRHFFAQLCDLRLTLFYVASRPMDQDLRFAPNLLVSSRQPLVPMEEIKSPEAREALQHARGWLVAEGCAEAKIHTKAVYSRFGTVHDIIQEGHAGKYDAVVLGKRCVSWFGELLDDSVSAKILWENIDFPVWICRRPDTGLSRNLLLCLDGSDAALRMADHVGFMLDAAPRHDVHLFHAHHPDTAPPAGLFQTAREALLENGVNPARIHEKIVPAPSISQAILHEARQGHYAVVALGRRRQQESPASGRGRGESVTQNLVKMLEDFSLWICK